jgi:hypothetical protein
MADLQQIPNLRQPFAPLAPKIVLILLSGLLSMFFAEVFSGSSPMWFTSGWGVFVTWPLYMSHLLLLINLAMIFKRTSLTQLYLWGVFFGLYESWITKVIWAGYMTSAPMWGTFLGFSVFEFFVIVFFWHPIMSFIVPILTFEILSGTAGEAGGEVFASHLPILLKRKRNWVIFLFIMIMGSAFLTVGSKANLVVADLTILGSLLLIFIPYWLASKKFALFFSIRSLRLGRPGLTILVLYMIGLYVWGFFSLLPERIAPLLTILLTVCIYAFIAALLFMGRPADERAVEGTAQSTTLFKTRELVILFATFIVMTTILSLLPTADFVVFFIINYGMFGAGVALLIIAFAMVIKSRIYRKSGN